MFQVVCSSIQGKWFALCVCLSLCYSWVIFCSYLRCVINYLFVCSALTCRCEIESLIRLSWLSTLCEWTQETWKCVPLSSGSLLVFPCVPRSQQVKCLKRCIEVSLCTLYDGYVIWHNASEHPSQIKWQMLFFASWIFLAQAEFWVLFSLSSASAPFLTFLLMTLQILPFCFLLQFRHNYCVIAGDRESVVADVSFSFLTDTLPSALFSVGVSPPISVSSSTTWFLVCTGKSELSP